MSTPSSAPCSILQPAIPWWPLSEEMEVVAGVIGGTRFETPKQMAVRTCAALIYMCFIIKDDRSTEEHGRGRWT